MDRAVKFLKRNWFCFAGALVGGIGGFLYWHFVGCASGTCPITGSPVLSTIWGALIVGLLCFAFFSKSEGQKKREHKNKEHKNKEHKSGEDKSGEDKSAGRGGKED